MSLSPQLNKLVRLIDQSLYESGYLISNSEGRRGGRWWWKGGCKCIDTGRVRGKNKGGEEERERRRKRETEQLDCHVNSCADR